VPGNVKFGDQSNIPLPAVVEQLPELLLGIIFTRPPAHGGGVLQLRIALTFEPPTRVIGNMKMEEIELVSSQHVDLLLE
jgi:hypothetical protein